MLEAPNLASAIGTLAQRIVDEADTATTLQDVVTLASAVIPDCHAAGVTLELGGAYLTAAYTDGITLAVDEGQYDTGHGPCLEAIRTGRTQRVSEVEADDRWPDFAAEANRAGIRSFLAAPLAPREQPIGALNLYSRQPAAFDEIDEELLERFARQAGVSVTNAHLHETAVTLGRQLQEAMVSRAVIEQAKGILMARRQLDPDAAFGLLRSWSQQRNVKLRDVARQVVAATVRGEQE